MAADSGATEKELQAFYGWKTNTQSQAYTRRANREAPAKTPAERLSANIYSRTLEQVRESRKNIELKQIVKDKDYARWWWTQSCANSSQGGIP